MAEKNNLLWHDLLIRYYLLFGDDIYFFEMNNISTIYTIYLMINWVLVDYVNRTFCVFDSTAFANRNSNTLLGILGKQIYGIAECRVCKCHENFSMEFKVIGIKVFAKTKNAFAFTYKEKYCKK